MLRNLIAAAAITTTLGLAACSSGPTPYQPGAGRGDTGYAESKIENDRYRISFKGNSLTERETVENYLLYRAAELTLQNGFDTFTIVNRDTDKNSSIRQSGGYMGSRMSYSYFVPRYGWVRSWDPFWSTPTSYYEVTRYEAFAEIIMGRGSKSSDPNAFDARQVSQNLAASIQRPSS